MQELTLLHNGIKTLCCAPVHDGDRYVYTFTAADIDSGVLEISLFEALAGDEGYFAIPYVNANFLTKFTARPEVDHVAREGLLMPMVGVRLNGEAFLMIFEGMPYDLRTRITVKDSLYRLSVVYDLDSISLYEPIKLAVYPLGDVDYSAMARRYRRYVSEKRSLVPLAQRSEPHMRYALEGMPVIRIRMGWKPVPTPIDEQTVATEPPMHVACTFADVEALIDEMRAQGIERAEICLVGWNVRGHDGRWPQAFPVEEAFGGEAGLKKLIAHVQSAGYRIVCHTNASDAYSIADSFNEEALIRKKNGAISVNGESWSGGRCYHLCPTPSFKNHQAPMLDSLKDLGFSGFHYIDVISVVAPRCCYHPEHPLNAADYVSEINRMLAYAKKNFGGASSEGCFDFCAGNLDFGLYAGFNVLDNNIPVADETIPLLQLVYHGYMLSNASAETINHMRKPARNRLKAYEYGSIPAVYFNSRFVSGDRRNWMGDDDMLFDTPELMKENVSRLKAEMDAYAAFAPRQLAFMDRHEKLSEGLFRITYSDGWRVIVNYNDTDTECEGIRVPANAFVQLPPKEADI